MKVLVLGASGLLGNTVFRVLAADARFEVRGTIRDGGIRHRFPTRLSERLVEAGDLERCDHLAALLQDAQPEVIVNCISAPAESIRAGDLARMLPALALLPQRLARLCAASGARLIHFSSDAVFSGARGGYTEEDCADPSDAYGTAKFLGEVRDPHAISIRTSMIGHGVRPGHGLLEWFLAQEDSCTVYPRAVFSGLPTLELARLVRDVVLPRNDLSGVYHVGGPAISKAELLELVARAYGKPIDLVPDETVVLDRSLDSSRFRDATDYVAPRWPEMIHEMRAEYLSREAE